MIFNEGADVAGNYLKYGIKNMKSIWEYDQQMMWKVSYKTFIGQGASFGYFPSYALGYMYAGTITSFFAARNRCGKMF